ncbi:MAG TPA: hypothetical protein VF131_04740 [Blastocatellia bacterium]|nr:hypothetical protein [Blastocatellia bacterium]
MESENENLLAPALDEFERYYTEKVWEWIPAVYKDEDGLPPSPDVLRSIVMILARQAAIARRSIDRLWDDQFIELCDDWAIPYIGELVGTRLVHELNRRGRRVDVARTIFYRRRKGTPHVLEILVRDITGWEGVVVESFRRLARTRHGLDPEPAELEGFVTQTSPGGWAKLTSTRGAELVDGPFDEMAHTPDFRQLRGKLGRYNIPKLNFHLFRLLPFEVNFATAVAFDDGRFVFDPSGRDIPLFAPAQRSDPLECGAAREWELPAPIPCRLLGAAGYQITTDVIDKLIALGLSPLAANQLSHYIGILFRGEARLRATIGTLSQSAAILALIDPLLANAITEDSPKAHLIPNRIQQDPSAVAVAVGPQIGGLTIEHQRIASSNLEDWGASLGMLPPDKVLVIDPERGRFWFPTPPVDNVWVPVYHYGFSGNIGAGAYDRRSDIATGAVNLIANGGPGLPGPVPLVVPSSPVSGVFQFENSKTYSPDRDVIGIRDLTYQAANFRRPYVNRVVAGGTEWIFEADPKAVVPPGQPEPATNLRNLTIEGLWIGIEQQGSGPSTAPCSQVPASLVLQGVFDRVVIRHCTLDPGGEKARIVSNECEPIPYVRLVVRGNVEELVIESSIVGPVIEDKTVGNTGTVQNLVLRDSIVQSIDPDNSPAIATELGFVEMQRVTVFGDVKVNRLVASEALIQGVVKVTDNQHGCFRFSATNDDPEKRLPPQFESHLFKPAVPNHFFVSRRFGDPGYAQQSETAPEQIVRGAENRSEIGAFSGLLNPIKLDDLRAKVNEFMPFGLITQFINET